MKKWLFLNAIITIAFATLTILTSCTVPPISKVFAPYDPATYLEEHPRVDVLDYSHDLSNKWGETSGIHIAILYYPPILEEMPYYVWLTPKGWDIIAGQLDWEPELDKQGTVSERVSNKSNRWDWVKYQHYKEGANFRPGERDRVLRALLGTYDHWARKEARDLWYRILVCASRDETDWQLIELDILTFKGFYGAGAGFHVEPVVVKDRGPTYAFVGDTFHLMATQFMWRERVTWTYIYRPAKEIPPQGELTESAWNILFELRLLGSYPEEYNSPTYEGGFSHPWQGRELDELGGP